MKRAPLRGHEWSANTDGLAGPLQHLVRSTGCLLRADVEQTPEFIGVPKELVVARLDWSQLGNDGVGAESLQVAVRRRGREHHLRCLSREHCGDLREIGQT